MNKEHVISDSLFSEAQAELAVGRHWIAYNTKTYYLDNADMWFFRDRDEAIAFADDIISDHDAYAVIHANSIISLMRQLPYGEDIHFNLTEKELEELFQSFDWNKANYDPLHDTIEATTEREKEDLAKMETLLVEWENLYNRDPEAALKLAVDHWEGRPMESYKDNFLTIKFDLMIEKNLDYLKTNVRNHGFGDDPGPDIEAQLKKGSSEFTLSHKTEVNKREMESTLYFGKSDKSELYFFNKYDTRVKNEKDETMAQTFYINHGWGVTLKEAYNLLNGRAIEKELVRKLSPEESAQFKAEQKLPPEKRGLAENWTQAPTYKAWIQLDFSAKDKHGNYERKQYHENYGYDLKEALSYYPIKEMMKAEDEKTLLRSLQRGNVQMVSVQTPGGDTRVFIEANPQYKSITVYDNKMKRLDQDQRQELMKKPELGEEKNKDKKQEQGLATERQDEKKPAKGKKNDKVNGENNGLVKKNRTGQKGKGMGV
jgi:hypothetical protein